MNRAAPASETPHPAQAFAARIDGVLDRLLLLIAARFRILGPVTVPLWNRVSRARQRLARLLANLAAGRLPLPRAASGTRASKATPRTPRIPLGIPRGRAWLVNAIGWEAAGFREQLASVLRDPAVPATLAASPGAARTIRGLCHLLGVTLPEPLRPAPARKAAPAPPTLPSMPAPPVQLRGRQQHTAPPPAIRPA